MHRWEKAGAVRVIRPSVIEATFDDGLSREVDVAGELWGPVLAPLRDFALLRQAATDPIGGLVSWPTGADLAPEFLSCGEETPYGRVVGGRPEHAVASEER